MGDPYPELYGATELSTMDARKYFWLKSEHLQRITPIHSGGSMFGVGRAPTIYLVRDLERLALAVHGKEGFEEKLRRRRRRQANATEMKEAVNRAAEEARQEILNKRKLAEKENERGGKAQRSSTGQPIRAALGSSLSANVASSSSSSSASALATAARPVQPASSSSSSGGGAGAASLSASKRQAQQEAEGYELRAVTREKLVKSLRTQLRRMVRNNLTTSNRGHPQVLVVEATCVLPEVFASLMGMPEDPTLRSFKQMGQKISMKVTCKALLDCEPKDVEHISHGTSIALDEADYGIFVEFFPSKYLLRVKSHGVVVG